MMNSRTRDGFALVEVITALVMIGFLLTSLLTLQSNSFRRVLLNTIRINHFYPVQEMMTATLMFPLKKGETKQQKQNEELGLTLLYQQKEVSGASELARFKGLYQRTVTGTWQEQGRERVQEMVGYGFAPPEKKS